MEPQQYAYESMGTHWEISIWDTLSQPKFNIICKDILKKSQDFDDTYSRFIKSSLIWSLSNKTGVFAVPKDFVTMLRWYKDLYVLSEKKLNPLVGFTLRDIGYDENYSLQPKSLIQQVYDLTDTLNIIDDTHIELKQQVLIDIGALGKGFFVDVITHFLKEKNIKRFLVNGSGDIYYKGNNIPIRIGLEHPVDTSKAIGIIEMKNGAMCSSANNRRAWGKYSHTIDPTSLNTPQEIIATWVIAESAVLADALATCLFFVSPENFSHNYSFEYCILNKDFKVKRSSGFNATLF